VASIFSLMTGFLELLFIFDSVFSPV